MSLTASDIRALAIAPAVYSLYMKRIPCDSALTTINDQLIVYIFVGFIVVTKWHHSPAMHRKYIRQSNRISYGLTICCGYINVTKYRSAFRIEKNE